MKYKDYYHGSYERLPLEVQEGLKRQYGTNDWPTVSRMWDQERGVTYTPRPVQSPSNNPSFNRSTYEKGTYTLPSPVSRAFNRLGQGISNAYNTFSGGLEDWAKRNPNWGDATLNMSRAVVDAQNAGEDALIAGTRAFVDTLDPTSQYNLERKQRLDALDPTGAEYRELVRKTALDLGVSESEAEDIIQRQNRQTNREKELTLENSIKALEATPESKAREKVLGEIASYMALYKVDFETARKALMDKAIELGKLEVREKIAKIEFREAQTEKSRTQSLLNNQKLEEGKVALEQRNLDRLYKASPKLGATYDAAYKQFIDRNPGNIAGAESAGWAAVRRDIDAQNRKNTLEIMNLETSVNQNLNTLRLDQLKLDEAIKLAKERKENKLTPELKNIFIANEEIARINGVADPKKYAWEKTLEQLERDADEQVANTANTRASTRQISEKTQDMINARDVGNPANLPMEERGQWYQAYNNAEGTPEQKRQNAWAFVIAGTHLEREDKQTSIELNKKKVEELREKIENGDLFGIEGTSADYKSFYAEQKSGRFKGDYLDWISKASGYKNPSELAAYIRAFKTGIKDEIAAGKVVLSDGTVLEGDAARAMTEAQIEEEATYRASNLKVQMKKDATTHAQSQKTRGDQRKEAVKARDSAAVMARTADEALVLLSQTETIQHGPMQAIVNAVYEALYQLQWASGEMKAEVEAMNLIEQLTTKFALTAVQMTKGAISDKEMKSFQGMFLSPDKSKGAVMIRMKIIKYLSLISRDFNQGIIEENDKNENFVDGKKMEAIRKSVQSGYKWLSDEIDAEITKYNDTEKGSSDTPQKDPITTLGRALSQAFKQGIANQTTVRSLFNQANLTNDQIREMYNRTEFAGLKDKIRELFPRTETQ